MQHDALEVGLLSTSLKIQYLLLLISVCMCSCSWLMIEQAGDIQHIIGSHILVRHGKKIDLDKLESGKKNARAE